MEIQRFSVSVIIFLFWFPVPRSCRGHASRGQGSVASVVEKAVRGQMSDSYAKFFPFSS